MSYYERMNDEKNIIFVTDSRQFDTMKYFQKYKFNCAKCGHLETRSFRKSHIEAHRTLLCQNCLNELWHGSASPFSRKEVQEKAKKTTLEKYGVEYGLQSPEIRKKIIDTDLNKYGSKCTLTDPAISAKARKSTQEHLGVDYALQSKEIYDRTQDTMKERYNTVHPLQVLEFLQKSKNTVMDHFGVDNSFKDPGVREKAKQTKEERYGDSNFNNRKQAKETCLKIYGCTHSIISKYNYFNNYFDSSWELAVWMYCKDHSIKIIRNPVIFKYYDSIAKEYHDYEVDFLIEGIGLVEIKGDQFFDENGNMINPYDHKFNDLFEAKHQCAIQNGVHFWTNKDIQKYLDYCNLYYPGWDTLYRKDNPYNPSYWCLYYNNPIMYYIPKYCYNDKGITPYNINKDNDGYVTNDNSKGLTPFDIWK